MYGRLVLEFKIANSIEELPGKAKEAVEQIIEKTYEQELKDLGYTKINVMELGSFPRIVW